MQNLGLGERLGVIGQGIVRNNAHLQAFFSYPERSAHIVKLMEKTAPQTAVDYLLAWGKKPSSRAVGRYAQKHYLPVLTIEDGFLRSLDTGTQSRHACALVVDDVGIYFDARYPSRLERLIEKSQLTAKQQQRADILISRITTAQLSKYNHAPVKPIKLTTANNVLLVDQVAGDQSIVGAGATAKTFKTMLNVALKQYPRATIWIKTHPASNKGYLRRYVGRVAKKHRKRIQLLTDIMNPIALLEQMNVVYTVSSHMGFEALMLGKPVYCFGVPWYAGWGLTDDKYAPKKLYQHVKLRRHVNKILANLFYAAYIDYSRYVDPATGQASDIEAIIDWLERNRNWQHKLLYQADSLTLYHLSFWKKQFVKAFIGFPQLTLQIKPKLEPKTILSPNHFKTLQGHNFVVWGMAKKQHLQTHLEQRQTETSVSSDNSIWCMEDGFIRSRGLGASLVEPLSVVLDKTGIYYDATQPSDLENILNRLTLSPIQEKRAQQLIQQLLKTQINKYNVGKDKPLLIQKANAVQSVILVVGQVEDDASIKYCLSDVKTNLALLQAVRQDNPTAYIIYKPHPDVEAKLRVGKVANNQLKTLANLVVVDVSMPQCLQAVDEVHTISSLTGFEALLRGKQVTCYGLPFYAGWGLTQDKITSPRRQRKLDLATLVYATLIAYPLYRLPNGYGLASVEQLIGYLADEKQKNQQNQALNGRLSARMKRGFMQLRHKIVR